MSAGEFQAEVLAHFRRASRGIGLLQREVVHPEDAGLVAIEGARLRVGRRGKMMAQEGRHRQHPAALAFRKSDHAGALELAAHADRSPAGTPRSASAACGFHARGRAFEDLARPARRPWRFASCCSSAVSCATSRSPRAAIAAAESGSPVRSRTSISRPSRPDRKAIRRPGLARGHGARHTRERPPPASRASSASAPGRARSPPAPGRRPPEKSPRPRSS